MTSNCRTKFDRPVRVCFLIDELGTAGVECQLMLLLKHLDRMRVKPYLCLLRGDGSELLSFDCPDPCAVFKLGVTSMLHPLVFTKALRLGRFLRSDRIDILHPLFPDSLYFGAPIAKLSGVPCVVRFRVNTGYWMKWIDRWLGRLLSLLLDATVVNCEACRNAVVIQEWASPKSITIIPNGIDFSRYSTPSPRNVTSERCVGIVANLRPVKNLELLVRAAAVLKPSHPDLKFKIAGEGDSRTELESLIQQLGLGDQFHLLGSVSNVPEFLQTLDLAVLCSRSEGSPNSIMEYMAAALPIVATNVGGNSELIEHEKHGLLVPSEDVEQLAAAIDRLLRDRDFALRLGTNARERALAEYSIERQARRYEDFYQGLLQGKRT